LNYLLLEAPDIASKSEYCCNEDLPPRIFTRGEGRSEHRRPSIDIDHFKKYNYGHDAGNMVFVRSAIAWKICSATKTFRAGSAARNSSSLCPGRTPGPGRLDRDPGVHCGYPRHETARR